MKKKILILTIVGIILATGVAYASETVFKRPVDILSKITGEKIEDLYVEKNAGKTFGQIAAEKEVLDAFKAEMLEQKKAVLEQRVKDGTLTQEQSNAFLRAMEERIKVCDGTTKGGLGKQSGIRFGNMGQSGLCQGQDQCIGGGERRNQGRGTGLGTGMMQRRGAGLGARNK